MCEFCHQHGEGKKWYLNAKNYSEDLLSDLNRQKRLKELLSQDFSPRDGATLLEQMDGLDKLPGFVRRVVNWQAVGRQKKIHYGQVLPIEDVEEIFGFVSQITRLACICRYLTTGKEARYCYGVTMNPQDSLFEKLTSQYGGEHATAIGDGTEVVTKEEALESFREHERQGACHTVWTFGTPFIGGICNCDRSTECLAMHATVTKKLPMMFRAEYVAQVEREKCNGCRSCMRACPFGAIGYSLSQRKAVIYPKECYGCGICRINCSKEAIKLHDRRFVPAAADIW